MAGRARLGDWSRRGLMGFEGERGGSGGGRSSLVLCRFGDITLEIVVDGTMPALYEV